MGTGGVRGRRLWLRWGAVWCGGLLGQAASGSGCRPAEGTQREPGFLLPECSSCTLLCRGMQTSKNKNTEKPEPFYRLSVPKQKTSSEIINEARNVLRTLRTQRPFTPTENQRKLFGSGSSLAPQNRPPSVFSIHASSFDLAESRPVSGVRLSPLDYKPVLVTCANDEDPSISLPKPAMDAAEVRKISSARAHLFRRTSQGNVFAAKMVPPDQNEEKLDSEEPARMSNLCRSSDICLTEQRAYAPFNDESGQLICNEHSGKLEREDVLKGTAGNFLFQLKGERSVTGDGRIADEEQPFPW